VRDVVGPDIDGHGPLLLGLVFILVVYLLPRGAAGLRWQRSPAAPAPSEEVTRV
jgi:branched-chain amino acid transport system permease protein